MEKSDEIPKIESRIIFKDNFNQKEPVIAKDTIKKTFDDITIKFPKYVGSVEICEGFIISLLKMPVKKHRENMKKIFGWKFQDFKKYEN